MDLKLVENRDDIDDSNNDSWTDFISHLSDVFIGKHKNQFTEDVCIELCDGSIAYCNCNAVSIVVDHPAIEGEYESIEKIAIIITDLTEEVGKRKKIEIEQKRTKRMIENIIPKQIVSDLIENDGNLAFVSQSATVGIIHITYNKQFNLQTTEIFKYNAKVLTIIDSLMNDFDLLSKVRFDGNRYIFAGGLFNKIVKPERHAEQSIRFSLKVIEELLSLSQSISVEINTTIGIHTSGPVIAGVMCLSKPAFQIIGPVMESALQIAETGMANQVHVSRSVYELIYSSGFRVHEKGEMTLRGGSTIQTYLISLQ